MGVLGHGASNVGLGVLIFILLEVSPVVVHVRGEGRIGMSVLGHGSSDIGLGILLLLKVCPVIMHVAREGGVRVSVLGHSSSNIRLRILSKLMSGNYSNQCQYGDILLHFLYFLKINDES